VIDAIYSIGSWIYDDKLGIGERDLIDFVIKSDETSLRKVLEMIHKKPTVKKGNIDYYVVKILIDLDRNTHSFDFETYTDTYSPIRYAYVGHRKGNKPQDILTVENPTYLYRDPKKNKDAASAILSYIQYLPISVRNSLKNLQNKLIKVHDYLMSTYSDIDKELKSFIKDKDIERNVALYTISIRINNVLDDLSSTIEYWRYSIITYFWPFKSEEIEGSCHICGNNRVFPDPKFPEGSLLKIYTLDKKGFISNIAINDDPHNMMKNFSICITCRAKILLGLSWVEGKYSSNIAGIPVILIPKVLGYKNAYYDYIFSDVNEFMNWRDWKTLEETLNDMKKYESMDYYTHIIFGRQGKSDFIFNGAILDVPITKVISDISERLEIVIPNLRESDGRRHGLLASFPFGYLANIVPIIVRRNEPPIIKMYIDILRSILRDELMEPDIIYKNAKIYARVFRYGVSGQYQFKPKNTFRENEVTLIEGILKYNLLLLYCIKANIIRGVNSMPDGEDLKNIPEKYRKYIIDMNLSEKQAGLYLIGVLLGRIGVEQYKKGDSKKSILDKLRFNGMSQDDLIRLLNYIPKGLRDYRLLNSESEILYHIAKRFIDRNLDELVNIDENLFYILSGYAHYTYLAIIGGGNR